MRCWIFFHQDLDSNHPEAPEVLRFQEVAPQLGIHLEVLKPQDFDLIVDSAGGWSATYGERLLHKPDVIIARTGSETSYFMLAVMRHFERQGVMMANGPAAIEAVADKLQTLQILSAAGLPTPKTILGKFPVDVDLVDRELGFPVVVKILRGTRGTGVLLCSNRTQFQDLASLLDGSNAAVDFIFQEYMRHSHGRDVRVLVVNGKVIAAMERRSSDGGFKSNLSLGGQGTAFDLPAPLADLARRAVAMLDLDVAGVDILFDREGYKICEVNSAPGFQGLERACGVNVPERIFREITKKYGLTSRRRAWSWKSIGQRLRQFATGPGLGARERRRDSSDAARASSAGQRSPRPVSLVADFADGSAGRRGHRQVQGPVQEPGHDETYEPRIGVERFQGRDDFAAPGQRAPRDGGHDRTPVPAASVAVGAAQHVQVLEVQSLPPQQPVVRDQNAGDGA